ncbi:MAG TPA: hypothetical protein DCE41_14810, partial [Cytophagales bacterium]|nr:hypothetical protein [Cytophagales bacterium]
MKIFSPATIGVYLFLCLISYHSAGQKFNWASAGGETVKDIIRDHEGNYYITGEDIFNSFLDSDLDTTQSAYLVKCSANGEFLWGKTLGTLTTEGRYLGIDSENNVYLTASYSYAFTYEGIEFPQLNGSVGNILLKADSEGELLFIKSIGGILVSGFAVMPDNGFLLAGQADEDVTLGDSTYQPRRDGFEDVFLVRGNPDGDIQWVNVPGGNGVDYPTDLVVNQQGIFVSGYGGNGSFQFGNQDIPLSGIGGNGFIVKYDLAGNPVWFRTVNDQVNIPAAIAVTEQGEIYLAGTYSQSDSNSGTRMVVGKLDSMGNTLFRRAYNYAPNEYYHLATHEGDAFLSTSLGRKDGGDSLPIPNDRDYSFATLLKFNDIGFPQWGIASSGTQRSNASSAFVSQDTILWGLNFYGDTTYLGPYTFIDNNDNFNSNLLVSQVVDTSQTLCPTLDTIQYLALDTLACQEDGVRVSIEDHPYAVYFQWYKDGEPLQDSTGASILITEPGVYYVKINEDSECSTSLSELVVKLSTDTSSSADITLITNPNLTVSLPEEPYCTGIRYTFSALADSNAHLLWSFPDNTEASGLTTNSPHVMWSSAQVNYLASVTVTDSLSGCATTNTFSLDIGDTPDSKLPDAQAVCVPDTTEIRAAQSASWTYAWSGRYMVDVSNEIAFVAASSTDTTDLLLTVVDTANGCSSSDTLQLISYEVIANVPGIEEDTTLLCEGETLSLEAEYVPNWNYQWLTDATLRGDTSTVVLSNPSPVGSEVTLRVTEATSRCTNETSFWVQEVPLPEAVLSIEEDSLILDTSMNVATILWFVDSTELSEFAGLNRIQPEGIGDFYAMVYSAEGCAAQTEVISID